MKVRGATITNSTFVRGSYHANIRIVVETLGAKTQVVRVKDATLVDENDNEIGDTLRTDSFELEPAATHTFELDAKTGETEPAGIGEVFVQAMPKSEWRAASLSEWQNSGNKGCY